MNEGAQPQERISDALFRLLVRSVEEYAILFLSPSGVIESWNEGAERILGYTWSEAIGKQHSIFYPPAELRHGKSDYVLRIAADEGKLSEENWRMRKDGTRFWASVVITAMHDADGALIGFAKVVRDLSERKQVEDERNQLLKLERSARAGAERAQEQLEGMKAITETALAHLDLDELLQSLLERMAEVLHVDT